MGSAKLAPTGGTQQRSVGPRHQNQPTSSGGPRRSRSGSFVILIPVASCCSSRTGAGCEDLVHGVLARAGPKQHCDRPGLASLSASSTTIPIAPDGRAVKLAIPPVETPTQECATRTSRCDHDGDISKHVAFAPLHPAHRLLASFSADAGQQSEAFSLRKSKAKAEPPTQAKVELRSGQRS